MSSARVVAGACLLLTLGVLPAMAQEPAVDRAALRARIDSLEVAVVAAESAWAQVQRGRRAAGPVEPLDTQRVGPLLVIARPDSRTAARAAVQSALDGFGPVTRAAAASLDSAVLLIEIGRPVAAFDSMRLRPHHSRLWIPGYRPASWRAEVVSRDVGSRLGAVLPAQVRGWLNGEGLSMNRDEGRRAAYRLLAVHPSPAARDCFAGAAERCADALGLTDPGAAYERWYTGSQLAAWLLADADDRPGFRASYEECANARSPGERMRVACQPYLDLRGSPPPPLDTNARRTLLAYALEVGGAGAWARLAAGADAPLLERLAAAAGISGDSLLSGWRHSVIDARPPHAAGFGASWLVTLAWVAAIAAVAMRSTRWRLG